MRSPWVESNELNVFFDLNRLNWPVGTGVIRAAAGNQEGREACRNNLFSIHMRYAFG